MKKSSLEELLEIYTQFKNHPLGRDLLEFATLHDTVESLFTDQSEAIDEHIVKAQLYNDSTAYKTLWSIYRNIHIKLKRKGYLKIATFSKVKEWLTQYMSKRDYNKYSLGLKSAYDFDYPSMENKLSYDNYIAFIDYFIDSCRDTKDFVDIITFRETVRKILGWEE